MTALEQLGAFVANHQPDERVCSGVRLHVADLIGAWIAACGTAEGRALMAFRKDADALADRVAVNVALARLSEIDDIPLAAWPSYRLTTIRQETSEIVQATIELLDARLRDPERKAETRHIATRLIRRDSARL